jgi:hypothetical protein
MLASAEDTRWQKVGAEQSQVTAWRVSLQHYWDMWNCNALHGKMLDVGIAISCIVLRQAHLWHIT